MISKQAKLLLLFVIFKTQSYKNGGVFVPPCTPSNILQQLVERITFADSVRVQKHCHFHS